jgi:release factor glutamine methyltransferase
LKIQSILTQSKHKLKENGIKSYTLDAELIYVQALSLQGREELILRWDEMLSTEQFNEIEKLIERRCKREPMSHILGYREFWEDKFKVTSAVLTPRPETEIIIEETLSAFQDKSAKLRICDLGTGSGCLAISLAKLYPNATVLAVDKSTAALEVAQENAQTLSTPNITFVCSDWFAALPEEQFDLIVCNPPYIPFADMEELQQDVRDFEPHSALTDGAQGLAHYQAIAEQMQPYMHAESLAIFEFGINQEHDVQEIFNKNAYNTVKFYQDLQGIIRGIIIRQAV